MSVLITSKVVTPNYCRVRLTGIRLTLLDPDEIRRDDEYPTTRLICRWFEDLKGGKLLVVSDNEPSVRHWIVTAFITRKPAKGKIEWTRP